jgi:BioD-like phosphotransacetylase family protein
MEMIRKAVDGKILMNEDCMNNKVEDIIAGSLVDVEEFHKFENILLVTSAIRLNQVIEKVESVARMKNLKTSPLSGVIVTSDGRHHRWFDLADLNHPYFSKHKIPVITTTLDSYGSVVKITRIEVKINNRTPWKTKRAVELFHEHVDFDKILKSYEL